MTVIGTVYNIYINMAPRYFILTELYYGSNRNKDISILSTTYWIIQNNQVGIYNVLSIDTVLSAPDRGLSLFPRA